MGPRIYSIAAHRGFADALVAGLVPRYSEEGIGLARLTLLLPSQRAARTIGEAFIRHAGAAGEAGLLMPRMAVVGDLDLDETLGALFDPLGSAEQIPPAADPTYRWLKIAGLVPLAMQELGRDPPSGAALLRMAQQIAAAMDRLLVENVAPDALWEEPVLQAMEGLAGHWRENTKLFYLVQQMWLAELQGSGLVDASTRRNLLFEHAARRWAAQPPKTPIVAAGVTSAAPALAGLLRTISDLPEGAVILPDLDLSLDDSVWDELGSAGGSDDTPFERGDALTHPQYHLKLLLNRMGVARGEVRQWHRKGIGAAPPERTHAISNLFLPPAASARWAELRPDQRRLSGVRLMQCANQEEEAQAIALLIREALEVPARRVSLITPDRALSARVAAHLMRWNIAADDSAGRVLSQTPAGRLFLLLAEIGAGQAAPVPLMALLGHPLVSRDLDRGKWLRYVRALELELRGPRDAPGLEAVTARVAQLEQKHPGIGAWWEDTAALLETLIPADVAGADDRAPLAALLDRLVETGEALAGESLWSKEDGRALSGFAERLRMHARQVGTRIDPRDLAAVLRDAMDSVAVRPPYGGHPRVAIYGLLESRMTRADLVICGGLNEGIWPAAPAADPLLAPAVLRALGVPGADFRIGLSAHDMAAALGAPEVVLSRAERDSRGPAIASRFLLRVGALLGDDLAKHHLEKTVVELARAIDDAEPEPPYPRPAPAPDAKQRDVEISVTALDRLRSDPYQFYAGSILRLRDLDALDAEPSAAWKGTVAHEILEEWHKVGGDFRAVADAVLTRRNAHPLMRALWRPRLFAALEWAVQAIADLGREVVRAESWGEMRVDGVRVYGKVDRIDRLPDGGLAIVDYKTGSPPSGKQVARGYALQLGTLGLMARGGGFAGLTGNPQRFEYWSLAKDPKGNSDTGFGYIETPLLEGRKRSGIPPEDFLPEAQRYLTEALGRWINGSEPFTARLNPDATTYDTYDQLMRLDEWIGRD